MTSKIRVYPEPFGGSVRAPTLTERRADLEKELYHAMLAVTRAVGWMERREAEEEVREVERKITLLDLEESSGIVAVRGGAMCR